jgi:hypothetical protein
MSALGQKQTFSDVRRMSAKAADRGEYREVAKIVVWNALMNAQTINIVAKGVRGISPRTVLLAIEG